MGCIKIFWHRIRSILLSLIRRSFKAHGSISVTDLTASLNFYKNLGFRKVTATRNDEVVLLRNHLGGELNLVVQISDAADSNIASSVSLKVIDIEDELERLRRCVPNLRIIEGSVSRQVRLIDPDGNAIELFQLLDPKQRPKTKIYHVATQSELRSGLSDHYYVPPKKDNRFVRARPRSAFMSLVCKRVAAETKSAPLVVEMDPQELSIEEQLFDEAEFDSNQSAVQSTYPRVNSPIPRKAIIAVGECPETAGDFSWPTKFGALNE